MSSCVIFKKDLDNLARKLMKEFYTHVHEDYLLNEFEEVRLKRNFYDEHFTKYFLIDYKNKGFAKPSKDFLSVIKDKELLSKMEASIKENDLDNMSNEDLLKKIETQIQDETLDVDVIYTFLTQMDKQVKLNKDIDFECDEDLFSMKKAFIQLYEVFNYKHKYLNLSYPKFD